MSCSLLRRRQDAAELINLSIWLEDLAAYRRNNRGVLSPWPCSLNESSSAMLQRLHHPRIFPAPSSSWPCRRNNRRRGFELVHVPVHGLVVGTTRRRRCLGFELGHVDVEARRLDSTHVCTTCRAFMKDMMVWRRQSGRSLSRSGAPSAELLPPTTPMLTRGRFLLGPRSSMECSARMIKRRTVIKNNNNNENLPSSIYKRTPQTGVRLQHESTRRRQAMLDQAQDFFFFF